MIPVLLNPRLRNFGLEFMVVAFGLEESRESTARMAYSHWFRRYLGFQGLSVRFRG